MIYDNKDKIKSLPKEDEEEVDGDSIFPAAPEERGRNHDDDASATDDDDNNYGVGVASG